MKRDMEDFVAHYLCYQQAKTKNQRLGRLIKRLAIPKWKREHISMYLVSGLSHIFHSSNGIWVIVDQLTKSSHFFPI